MSTVTRRAIKCSLSLIVGGVIATMAVDTHRHVTEDALYLIGGCESCRLDVYPDPVSRSTPYTVGVGATRDINGFPLKPGNTVTDNEVIQLFARDVMSNEQCIITKFKGESMSYNKNNGAWSYDMPQPVFDSLASVIHTVGCNGISKNKYGKDTQILKDSLNHNWDGVCMHITDFVYAGGKVNAGIKARRYKERAMCEKWRYTQ